MTRRKIVLFGGTFDPIHLGHTTVAAEAAEHIGAEKIVFIPAKRSPLKDYCPEAVDDDRLKMTALAICGNKNFQVSDFELKAASPSYTLQTVKGFQTDYGSDTLIYWLAGADSVNELPRWHKIGELIDTCVLCVMYRAGYARPNFDEFTDVLGRSRVEKLQRNVIKTSLIDISSSRVRSRLADGEDVSDMLHPLVADYIRKQQLYQLKGGC